MAPFTVRTARLADLPALLVIEARFPGDRLSPRQFRYHLASPRARLRVATSAADGVLGYHLLLVSGWSRWGRLYSLAVDPAARGRGVGRSLLADAERQARTAGCHGMKLEVRQDNLAARALYEGAGYRFDAALPGYYDDGGDGWRLTRRWD